MLRRITVTCPQCHLVCQLHLGNDAPMVVIRCPNCGTSLMSYGGKAVVLSEPEMDALRRGEGEDLVARCLAGSPAPDAEKKPQEPEAHPIHSHAHAEAPRGMGAGARNENGPGHIRGSRTVSHDDVLDLYRELELCEDSGEFIDRLG